MHRMVCNEKRIIIISIIVIFVMFLLLLAKYGRIEIVSVNNPLDSDYYIKIYQIGYWPSDEYMCLCILYGPNGEILMSSSTLYHLNQVILNI